MKATLKRIAKTWLEQARMPAAARAEQRRDAARLGTQGLRPADPGPQRIMAECIAWLGRAQDGSATQDGGVARDFSLLTGWATSYPETTCYIVPTKFKYG